MNFPTSKRKAQQIHVESAVFLAELQEALRNQTRQNLAGVGIYQTRADGAHRLRLIPLHAANAKRPGPNAQTANRLGMVVSAELGDGAHNDGVNAQDLADLGRRGGVGAVAVRSITEYLPSFTSFSTSMSVMPFPTSWLVP